VSLSARPLLALGAGVRGAGRWIAWRRARAASARATAWHRRTAASAAALPSTGSLRTAPTGASRIASSGPQWRSTGSRTLSTGPGTPARTRLAATLSPRRRATKCPGHSSRTFIKECWVLCGCSTACHNRVVQQGISAPPGGALLLLLHCMLPTHLPSLFPSRAT